MNFTISDQLLKNFGSILIMGIQYVMIGQMVYQKRKEVFNLNFEVFGSEGDVTDRKSNAFLKHDRLIASIDTMKRPERIQRLLEAPLWDLVVFDEAHHLNAYKAQSQLFSFLFECRNTCNFVT